jgi:hypothetical protein
MEKREYCDESSFCDSQEYEFDFKLKTEKKHKSSVKKEIINNVKTSKQSVLSKISSLEIPQQTKELLTKLVMNHKLEGIESVKQGSNSMVLHSKVSENFITKFDQKLDSDVMMKIFLQKGQTRPDVEAAKNSHLVRFSVVLKSEVKHHHHHHDCENLQIVTLENVVIMKMVGNDQPAKNVLEIVQQNPQKVKKYLKEILNAVRIIKSAHPNFWTEKTSMHKILWCNNRWVFLRTYPDDPSKDFSRSNFFLLFETFKKFGITTKEILKEFYDVTHYFGHDELLMRIPFYSKNKRRSEVIKEHLKLLFHLDEIQNALAWKKIS